MIIRYLDPIERLEFEIHQQHEVGNDVRQLQQEFEGIRESVNQEAAETLLKEIDSWEVPADLARREPNELAAIQSARPESVDLKNSTLTSEMVLDKVYGGWLGRAAGCLLGKPVERHPREAIREILQSSDQWPLQDYFTAKGVPAAVLKAYPWKRRWGFESLRENIACMPEDDDLNYTMLNLHILETHGHDFSTADVGMTWLKMLPAYEVFTAERVAYYNLLAGFDPPVTASHMNPFREWIGAEIRADLWGYVCPGDPERAAEYAWRDAQLSHVANGIYGEMYVAAMIAAAFVESDPRRLIQVGLSQIPEHSRLAEAIRFILALPEETNWEVTLDRIYTELGHYHWVHTINNAALTTAALLHGRDDFEKTICATVMGGWDTDSNGASAGSIQGVIQGARALPAKWINPLRDEVRSSVSGYDHSRFSSLARRTVENQWGGRSDTESQQATRQDDF